MTWRDELGFWLRVAVLLGLVLWGLGYAALLFLRSLAPAQFVTEAGAWVAALGPS